MKTFWLTGKTGQIKGIPKKNKFSEQAAVKAKAKETKVRMRRQASKSNMNVPPPRMRDLKEEPEVSTTTQPPVAKPATQPVAKPAAQPVVKATAQPPPVTKPAATQPPSAAKSAPKPEPPKPSSTPQQPPAPAANEKIKSPQPSPEKSPMKNLQLPNKADGKRESPKKQRNSISISSHQGSGSTDNMKPHNASAELKATNGNKVVSPVKANGSTLSADKPLVSGQVQSCTCTII